MEKVRIDTVGINFQSAAKVLLSTCPFPITVLNPAHRHVRFSELRIEFQRFLRGAK